MGGLTGGIYGQWEYGRRHLRSAKNMVSGHEWMPDNIVSTSSHGNTYTARCIPLLLYPLRNDGTVQRCQPRSQKTSEVFYDGPDRLQCRRGNMLDGASPEIHVPSQVVIKLTKQISISSENAIEELP